MTDHYEDIIHRMMRQLDEEDASPKGAPSWVRAACRTCPPSALHDGRRY
jgi:hypothetical protein